ncbi:hypothetical protein [Falsibacillus pallidus]|uniref:hypothetical protein n=1 Tax=Falsibacillus pallidus TaxID=493781 RepID=UPI003D997C2E
MDYLFEWTSDPVVYAFYASIIFSFAVFKTWRWFQSQPLAQDGVRPSLIGCFTIAGTAEEQLFLPHVSIAARILKTVKRLERPTDEEDHLLLLTE